VGRAPVNSQVGEPRIMRYDLPTMNVLTDLLFHKPCLQATIVVITQSLQRRRFIAGK
jgi:hypothetical protein